MSNKTTTKYGKKIIKKYNFLNFMWVIFLFLFLFLEGIFSATTQNIEVNKRKDEFSLLVGVKENTLEQKEDNENVIEPDILKHSDSIKNNRFVAIYPSEELTLDPHKVTSTLNVQLQNAIYEGLVSLDPKTLAPIPALAERWEISDGGKKYRFYLRKDLKFSDGTPLDTQSFYRSFLRLLDPKISREYAYLLDGVENGLEYRLKTEKLFSNIGFKAIDSIVFEITLKYPIPYFLSLLTHHVFIPISSYQLPLMWDNYTRIAYSGAYIITGLSKEQIFLTKNPFYWDNESVQIEHLTIIRSDNIEKNTQNFLEKKAHWVLGGFDLATVKKQVPNHIISSIGLGTQFYYFADDNPIFKDRNIRKALFLLIPWDELYKSQSTPARSLIPVLSEKLGYERAKQFKTNRAGALKLLKKSGFPNGKGLPELVILTNSIYEPTAKLIGSSWLGLDTKVRVHVPEGNYFEYLEQAKATIVLSGWVADYIDPMAFLTLFSSNNALNRSIYTDFRYDDLLFKSNLYKGKFRVRILGEAEELLLSDYVVIPVNHSSSMHLVNWTLFKGWYSNPLNLHPFKYFSFQLNTFDNKQSVYFGNG